MTLFRQIALSVVLALSAVSGANAQLLDAVKGAMGSKGTSATPDLTSVGTGNIAGVVTYCAKNNYLGGGAASVKDKLLGKLGGERKAKSDAGYQEGLKGILGGKSGQKMDLGGSGLKAQLTEKVCDQVLTYGKSLI